MHGLVHDLRHGLRTMLAAPAFTAAVVLVLALGVAANSTVFSWINSTLLDPVPGVSDSGELASVTKGEWTASPFPPFSYEDFKDLAAGTRTLSGMLGYHDMGMSLTGGTGRPRRILGTLASPGYFDVLRVRPVLGRGFAPQEGAVPGGVPVAVISHSLWQELFGGDPAALGRTIEINRRAYTVIGVAPRAFHGCKTGIRSDVWIPFTMDPLVTGWGRIRQRGTCWLNVLGRLAPGSSRRGAQAELELLMQAIARQHPASHRGPQQVTLDPLWRSPFGMNYMLSGGLTMLWALAAVLLLLACANVANLLLVRGVARRRELAIRLSLGASRLQLVRQLLAESLLLGLGAAVAAVVATWWTAGLLPALIPPGPVPIAIPGRVDARVLLVTLAVAVASSLALGIVPALHASQAAPASILKEEGARVSAGLHRSRLARALVALQVALSFVLLFCAGLFVRSYRNAQSLDLGFDREQLLLASFDLQSLDYSREQGIAFDRQLLARLRGLPGTASVSLANAVPFFGSHSQEIAPEGYVPRPGESMEVGRVNVGPDYFATMGIPIVAGREIDALDGLDTERVVVVNQKLARKYWPGQDPLGRKLQAYGTSFRVVGVARDARYGELRREVPPTIFPALFQVYYQDPTIHLRVRSGDPRASADALEKVVAELNPELALFDVASLSEVTERGIAAARIAGALVSILAALALLLAAVGVYGVIAYATRQRTHEIGVRLALGAAPASISALVLSQGMALVLAGLGIGVAVTLAASRALRRMLLGVSPTDLATYAAVAVLLAFVALAACVIPAVRASRLPPQLALRQE